ncbi:MAG TPA: OmpA family protein [Arenimonas sp.]|uniref:OmpA family protein n=1 Tax=Arenimonas sp. TaxID=1872635 RepID=UPI002BAA342F|nr:OmpA family protein [Arenimonas sp.]HMB55618.1 OmpA family protein [Arenimonas sp.]
MRVRPHVLLLPALLVFAACSKPADVPPADTQTPSPATTPAPAVTASVAAPAVPATVAAPVATAVPANTEFDPASVPVSTATLPPFPFFKTPEGLTSIFADKEKNASFDREHMIAGGKIVAIEGKVFREGFKLDNPEGRSYSDIEFQRNYENAITALGGVKVSTVQYTDEVNQAFGSRDVVDKHYHGACAGVDCQNDTYLIRQNNKETWIQVSTGAIPLHGYVTVLERQAMTSALSFLSAGDMKKALDADGHVALHINFDTDKATLRPDAGSVIDEIGKLLQSDPSLKLSIEGHTDSTGSADHNRSLSGERAASVRSALVAKGIAADRLSTKGFGPDKPVADNGSESGRAKNRRVELVKMP